MAFVRYSDIADSKFDESQYLHTGIKKLDKAIVGLGMGQLVVVTGIRGGGKTTFIGQIVCNFINNGYSGLLCSFEMSNPRLKKWLNVQALGEYNLTQQISVTGKEYYEPKTQALKEKVESWINERLEVYDNLSFNVHKVAQDIEARLKENPSIKFIILDNLMKLDSDELKDDKYKAQSKLVKDLQVYAQSRGICVILVAHPNKVKTLPRIEDVGGSGDIINTADTVLLIHRVTRDFVTRAKDQYGWEENNPVFEYSNIIEVAKDREFGTEDTLVGVYFEPKAKRFLNYKGENIKYSWQQEPKQGKLDVFEEESNPFDDDNYGGIPF